MRLTLITLNFITSLSGPVDDPIKLPKWNYLDQVLVKHQGMIDLFRRANHILVYTPADEPILTNNRCNAAKIFSHPDLQLMFLGMLFKFSPIGWPTEGYPDRRLAYIYLYGPYYCGIGADKAFGRDIVDAHYKASLHSGINISSINGEVMPGQKGFSIGQTLHPFTADFTNLLHNYKKMEETIFRLP
ncbi:hypothetical protein DCAR_0311408 [Daucus carota subsp. sativus]|uniref:Glutamate--ammonia ligase n=1 Tax=Daucus carota subsp. sativus TaxID=79200 RepID=A0AAF0WPL6_DAUCS|nr:hypothetical protein DCAR_0311408 [Daucus carota subsp. sativus]